MSAGEGFSSLSGMELDWAFVTCSDVDWGCNCAFDFVAFLGCKVSERSELRVGEVSLGEMRRIRWESVVVVERSDDVWANEGSKRTVGMDSSMWR